MSILFVEINRITNNHCIKIVNLMKPSALLFELIKSLTSSEKRYFKLYASLQKGNKNYTDLFNVIDSMQIYDEKILRKSYGKERSAKNLTFTKNYLYKLIFKSLNSYKEERSVDSRLTNILNRCRILFDKSLIRQYFKTLEYGKQLALKYERFSYLIEFLEIERQLIKKKDIPGKDFGNVYNEENKVIEILKNVNEHKRAVNLLFNMLRVEGIIRSKAQDEEINKILLRLGPAHNEKSVPVIVKETYYFANYIACELRGDLISAFEFIKKRFELISRNEEIFRDTLFDSHKDSFLMMITAASDAGKFRESFGLFSEFVKLYGRSEVQKLNIIFNRAEIHLNHAIHTKHAGELNEHISGLEKDLLKYRNKITIATHNSLYFKLAKFHFVTGNHNEALRIINELFKSRHLKYSPHLEIYVRMLNILIHFELENYKLLNYVIPATVKYLKSKDKYFRTESAVISCLKIIAVKKEKTFAVKNLSILHKELKSLMKIRYEKNAFMYIDYIDWVNKKLSSIN